VKHINVVHGRKETDPGKTETDSLGLDLLSRCLAWGSLAWYRCEMAAKTAIETKDCTTRLLHAPQ
jgi:hypothetical protein